MRHLWHVWLAFGVCLAVAVVAVGWLSYRALESERAERMAGARATLEENARLALWRIDSAVAALIAQENANPYSVYQSFRVSAVPKGKASKVFRATLIPSPLLTATTPAIKLHFEFAADGTIHSPEVPSGSEVSDAVPKLLSAQTLDQNRAGLEALGKLIDKPQLAARLRGAPTLLALENFTPPQAATSQQPLDPLADFASQNNAAQQAFPAQSQANQQARGNNEFQARAQAVSANSVILQNAGNIGQNADATPPALDLTTGVMAPLWVGDQLLLVRRVVADGKDSIQGAWLNWPPLREQLLANVRDLLPEAALEPADPTDGGETAHRMAALPVTLETGELPLAYVEVISPVRLSLLITWGSLALAALAVALLLRGVLALSERRAAFVSAVTHELRTPLTTFRMYAEMLAEGMVPDEADRRRYLQTLHTEADRLTHLVENVLAYARLERGGPAGRIGPVPVGELLERASERLADRAASAGFKVELSVPPEVVAASALADPGAVEQILFNLVDNACKYARTAEDRTLRLEASRANGQVLIRLRDSGPGVALRERKRLFQPFRKSASDAAHSAPGVGLGLALSRRLARDMGGDLAIEDQVPAGASFVLTLKAAPR
jgi:signal transduction histidine kinase